MSDIGTLIHEAGAVKYGKFKLSDGILSDYYIDKYNFETQPEVLSKIADEMANKLADAGVDVLAGPELGAVPLVTAVSLKTGIPSAYIRKGEKNYGTQARIEGNIEKGDRVAVIEDVTTTGNTLVETVETVEEVGGTPTRLLVVIDRDQGAVENLQNRGYELEHLAQVGEELEINPP